MLSAPQMPNDQVGIQERSSHGPLAVASGDLWFRECALGSGSYSHRSSGRNAPCPSRRRRRESPRDQIAGARVFPEQPPSRRHCAGARRRHDRSPSADLSGASHSFAQSSHRSPLHTIIHTSRRITGAWYLGKIKGHGPKPVPCLCFEWSGRRDLNPRPQRPERCALTKLRYSPTRPHCSIRPRG